MTQLNPQLPPDAGNTPPPLGRVDIAWPAVVEPLVRPASLGDAR